MSKLYTKASQHQMIKIICYKTKAGKYTDGTDSSQGLVRISRIAACGQSSAQVQILTNIDIFRARWSYIDLQFFSHYVWIYWGNKKIKHREIKWKYFEMKHSLWLDPGSFYKRKEVSSCDDSFHIPTDRSFL